MEEVGPNRLIHICIHAHIHTYMVYIHACSNSPRVLQNSPEKRVGEKRGEPGEKRAEKNGRVGGKTSRETAIKPQKNRPVFSSVLPCFSRTWGKTRPCFSRPVWPCSVFSPRTRSHRTFAHERGSSRNAGEVRWLVLVSRHHSFVCRNIFSFA